MTSVPTFQTTPLNVARNASEARYSHLWKGVIGNWQPGLGPTGNVLHDLSGFGRHGTLTNMPPSTAWVQSDGRWALDFPDDDDYVDLGVIDISGFPAIGLSIWFRWDENAGDEHVFFGTWQAGNFAKVEIRLEPAGNRLEGLIQTTTAVHVVDFNDLTINDTLWHHAVMTYQVGDAMRMYLDGRASSTTFAADGTLHDTAPTNSFYLGRDARDQDPFTGSLDDAILYNRAPKPSEVSLLSQLGRGGWMARRQRVFAKAPVAPPVGISVGRHYPRGVGRGIGRGVAA